MASTKKLPQYVNELFTKIAQENGFTQNFSMEINSSSELGDGFSSEIFRVVISDVQKVEKLHLVCKIAPTNDNFRREFLLDENFRREALLYENFMPMLAKFQEEKQLPPDDQFRAYPKCYGTVIDDVNERYAIVLEDLKSLGFKMWTRDKPTTIGNARMTMRELGKFHGLSMAMKHQRPVQFAAIKKVKSFDEYRLRSQHIVNMIHDSYEQAIKALKNPNHKSILRHFQSNIQESILQCFDEKAVNRFGVLCHGDCWNNNLQFKFNDEGVPQDIQFLDWQMIRYSSPATDLVDNLFSSTDKALRDKEYHNLIRLYYESLSKTINLLGSTSDELFTFDDLINELKQFGVYALLISPLLMGVLLADPSEVSNLDEMFDKVASGEGRINLVSDLSAERQLEYDRRMNDVFEDVINLGYYPNI